MPVRATRSRVSPARRRNAPTSTRSVVSYRQTRATIVLMFFVLVFGFLWLFNGELTARFVMGLTEKPATWGWSAHLIITVVEIAPAILAPYLKGVPRWLVIVLWLLSLPFGVFDVLSSAVGVMPYFTWTGLTGVQQHTQNVVIAELIGFLPEQAIFWLSVALGKVLKG